MVVMIQEFISKEILPHIFWVFAPKSRKWIFCVPIDCEMKLIILKTEQPFLKALQFGNSFLSFNSRGGIAVFC